MATGGDEIRVAQGTYKPDQDEGGDVTPGERTETFQFISGVELFGGYRGCPGGDCGGVDPDDRDIEAFEAILSGDLYGDDAPVACAADWPDCEPYGRHCVESLCIIAQGNEENAYSVVTGTGTDATAVLDGFTITRGNARGSVSGGVGGGGMYNYSGSPTLVNCTFSGNAARRGGGMCNWEGSEPMLIHCTFSGNYASNGGGGIYNVYASPTLIHCTFDGNSASEGGGIYGRRANPMLAHCVFSGNVAGGGAGMYTDYANPTLTNCTFKGDQAWYRGGGIHSYGDPTLINCTFSGNTAGYQGGGMYSYYGSPTLTNCTFSGNSGQYQGGGMYNRNSLTLTNCTFSGNSAEFGGGLYTRDSPTLANCILWGNTDDGGEDESAQLDLYEATPSISFSCIQGWTGGLGGTGNFGDGPLLADADGADDVPGTDDDNLRLSHGSPCIDAADNTAVPADVADLDGDGDTDERTPLDLDANPRFVDDPGTADAGVADPPDYLEVVDLGAYEFPGPCSDDADCEYGNDCTNDVCEAGVCTHRSRPLGTTCGDPTSTDCTDPNTCNGSGACLANDTPDTTACSDDGNDCTIDECNAGTCVHPPEPAGTTCGDPTDTDCNGPDICDETGRCLDDLEPNGTACADDGNDCTDDACEAGVCDHPPMPVDAPCGNSSDSECDHPDTCDGLATCLDNVDPDGLPCTDFEACTRDDQCAGGACEGVYEAHPYGDVTPFGSIVPPCPADTQGELGDGFANMLDVFCAFNAFNEGFQYTECPCADVAPCGGDSFVNMQDVFAIFNAFNDDPACLAPCP